MQVTFRTVSGETFKLEVEDSLTVAALKARVSEARDIVVDTLKLVYK